MKRLLAVVVVGVLSVSLGVLALQGSVGAALQPQQQVKPVAPVDVSAFDHSQQDVADGEEQLPCYGVGVDLNTGKEFTSREPCDYVISQKEAEAAEHR